MEYIGVRDSYPYPQPSGPVICETAENGDPIASHHVHCSAAEFALDGHAVGDDRQFPFKSAWSACELVANWR